MERRVGCCHMVRCLVVLLIFIADVIYVSLNPTDYFWFAIVLFLGVVCLIGLLACYLCEAYELEIGDTTVANYGSIDPKDDLPPRYSSIIVDTETPSVDSMPSIEIEYKERFLNISEEGLPTYASAICNGDSEI